MKLETLLFEVSGGVALITLNRPERLNAMNRQMLRDIHTALDRVEADADIRVAVVNAPEQIGARVVD